MILFIKNWPLESVVPLKVKNSLEISTSTLVKGEVGESFVSTVKFRGVNENINCVRKVVESF